MFQIFRPHYRLDSVLRMTPEWLSEVGLSSLLLDVDSTLKAYRNEAFSEEILNWLAEMKRSGIGLCLVSNGHGGRIGRLAESLDLPFVAPAFKPLAIGCKRAMLKMSFDPKSTAMVGDQVFADIAAANLAGITAILIEPIRPEQEPLWTRIKRPLERLLLGKRPPKTGGDDSKSFS